MLKHNQALISSFHEYFQLAISKKGDKNTPYLYEMDGNEALGSYLRIYPCSESAPNLSECTIQWYRSTSEGGKKELISGIYVRPIMRIINMPLSYLYLDKAHSG